MAIDAVDFEHGCGERRRRRPSSVGWRPRRRRRSTTIEPVRPTAGRAIEVLAGRLLRRAFPGGGALMEYYRLHVNGVAHDVADAWLGESLLYVLRERLGLLGAKGACEEGECGSCSVLVDDTLVCSCLVMAASALDRPIVTVEGISEPGTPSDVQQAFLEAGAVQCGFCTPGLVMAAHALLDHNVDADRDRDPRAALRQHLPMHRLRTTDRGRPTGVGVATRGIGMSTDTAPLTTTDHRPGSTGRGGIGESTLRPDGLAKVQGNFSFSSDVPIDGARWGATLRSPHPYARIRSIDISPALAIAGVSAVITADDVPGRPTYGLIAADQPVFASDVVRYVGEPVAAVAADHPETCRRALAAIVVDYEVLEPLLDAEAAIDGSFPPIHPDGNVLRSQHIRRGDPDATGPVVVEGTYELGMQDQAFLGLEAAVAVPDHDGGGVEVHVATQWLHEDRKQIAACLAIPEEQGSPAARWGRRRVRCPRGHQPPGPHLSPGAAGGWAGADGLQPVRELPRARPSPPRPDLDAPPRHRGG